MLDASLPLTTSEYIEWGNPNTKTEFDYMMQYSPYDNIKRQAYPSMLVKTSLNDSQVMYWEGAKFAARLRAMKTDRNPLLLKVNFSAGHGGVGALRRAARDGVQLGVPVVAGRVGGIGGIRNWELGIGMEVHDSRFANSESPWLRACVDVTCLLADSPPLTTNPAQLPLSAWPSGSVYTTATEESLVFAIGPAAVLDQRVVGHSSELVFHAAQLDADPVRILQHHASDFRGFRELILTGSGFAVRKTLLHHLERVVGPGHGSSPIAK